MNDMNYLRQINAFYDWQERNELPGNAIALWYALMHIANKAGWPDSFTVPMGVLIIKSGLNSDAVNRARNLLTQKGLITWKPRGGSKCAEYTVPQIDPDSAAQSADNPQTTRAQPAHNPQTNRTINKLNETKLNGVTQEDNNTACACVREGPPDSPTDVQDHLPAHHVIPDTSPEDNIFSDQFQPLAPTSLEIYFSKNQIAMTSGLWEQLAEIMRQGITEDIVRLAIDEAVANGSAKWSYLRQVLNSWIIAGVTTVDGARQEQAKHRATQQAKMLQMQKPRYAAPERSSSGSQWLYDREAEDG